MKNLNVKVEDFAAQVEYPLPEAPGWGMELRGPVKALKANTALSRGWLRDCEIQDRNTYVAFPKSLSPEDLTAIAYLQKGNNYGDYARTGNPYFTGLKNDGLWFSIEPLDGKLKVSITFTPLWKNEE